jgi:TolB protein
VTELIMVNVDGTGERKVATRTAPNFFFSYPDGLAWSPDGRVIACRAGSTDANGFYRNVVGVRVADGTETPISSHRWKWIGGIAWLHDGDGLLITASDLQQGDQAQQVWRLSYPGGEAQRITNDLSAYLGMSLASDSATMLTLQQNVFSSIWVASAADATKGRQITRGNYEGRRGVSWTPDGRIVYSSRSGDTDQIWIMDAEGSNQKQLTTGPGMNIGPTVTSDGRHSLPFLRRRHTESQHLADGH